MTTSTDRATRDALGGPSTAFVDAQLRALYDAAPLGLCLLDSELRFVSVNHRFAALSMRTVSAHLGRTLREISPDLADSLEQACRRALETGSPVADVELRSSPGPAGAEGAWLASCSPALDEGGRAVGVSVVVQDVTRDRRTERALLESQDRNQAILSALPDMMFIMSTEGVYLDVHFRDPGDLLMPPEQFLGRSMFDVLPADLARQFARSLGEVAAGGSAVVDYSLVIGGERRQYEARLVRCGSDRILSIVRDVTESKRAQSEAHHGRLELARASRITVLGEITASLAHELSQPLAAILANAQASQRLLAGHRVDRAEMEEILADIVEGSKRAGEFIRRLRHWLAPEPPLRQRLGVNQVVEEVRHLVRSELIIRNVPLATDLQEPIPDVLADCVQLQQVILNLVLNGVESMGDRPADERQLVVRTSSGGDGVTVAVRDRGTGIPPAHAGRLFDAFFTTKTGGLGMGLRICSSIVQAHGGRISAANNEDGGATFSFTLPAAPSA